mgnify:CR=1 FL=1
MHIFLYICAIFAPGLMTFFCFVQLSQAITENTIDLKSKITLAILLASLLYNLYILTSLYF